MGRRIREGDPTQLSFYKARKYCAEIGASIPYVQTEADQLILLKILNLIKEDKSSEKYKLKSRIWIEIDDGKWTFRRKNKSLSQN